MIFLDATVLLAAEDLDDSNHEAAAALLRTGALGTLDLAGYEVTNVAEARWRDAQASQRLRERVWAIGELGALVRIDRTLAERTAELSRRHTLSAYDAAYVAGAKRIGAAYWRVAMSATSSRAGLHSCRVTSSRRPQDPPSAETGAAQVGPRPQQDAPRTRRHRARHAPRPAPDLDRDLLDASAGAFAFAPI